MSTRGCGSCSGLGLGSGGEPFEGRTSKILSLHWDEEMEGVFRTSPYPIGAKVRFTLDLLYRSGVLCGRPVVSFIVLVHPYRWDIMVSSSVLV